MALQILMADPDESWLDSMEHFFQTRSYEVFKAINGKEIQRKLYNQKFFAVIMSYDIKEHSALEVLTHVCKSYPDIRVIVILEREHLPEKDKITEKLTRLGVDEIVEKPFSKEDLCRILEGHQTLQDMVKTLQKKPGQSQEEEVGAKEEEFSKVSINNFYSFQSVLFDVYVKIGESRFVKILHMGDEFNRERLDKYKNEKGVEFLYFHKKDRQRYIKFNDYLAKTMMGKKRVKTRSKINLLKNISEKYMEESFEQGIRPQVLVQGREICGNIYQFIESSEDLYKHLRSLNDFDASAFSHGYLVTLFSSSMMKQFEWQSKTMIANVALACMFHDIGKMKLPESLLNKPKSKMTSEEVELYQQHPVFGAEILDDARDVNHSVKQIILQHHEAFDGSGYPNGFRGPKVMTLANVVSCADTLVDIMLKDDITPIEALKRLLSDKKTVAKFNSSVVEKLIHVFTEPEKLKATGSS